MSDVLVDQNEEVETEDQEPQHLAPTATVDQLKKKQRVTKTITLVVTGDDGDTQEVSLSFRGIPAHEYDRLIAAFPPRSQDKKQGYAYNPDKFGPAIVAATCIAPEMTVEDVTEIWNSDTWNRGERMMLLMAAVEVCTAGLDLPLSRRDSE